MMYKIPLADIKEKIVASGKLSLVELESKLKSKINDLSGLISEEGAAHIIANELGIKVVPDVGKLQIREIYAGMRDVSVTGKVVRKYEAREFAKGDSTGRVCSIMIGDETGTIRVVFWNEQVDLLENLKEGDVVEVIKAYVRENNNSAEVHLGRTGDLDINPEGVVVKNVVESSSGRKAISELIGGEQSVELMGTVVQVFDPRFFSVHPETGRRLRDGEDVIPAVSYVLNAVIDDGSGTIRCVFWKNQTHGLLKKNEEEMVLYKEDLASFQDTKTDLLGEQYKLTGRVQKNEMFDRLEFHVQVVETAKPEEEIERM